MEQEGWIIGGIIGALIGSLIGFGVCYALGPVLFNLNPDDTLIYPLTDIIVPTYDQVREWVDEDNTDEFNYTEGVLECGDFATILMTRAKAMNWRMRIACMRYSFFGEFGYGTTDPYGSNGHAFNLIYCQDGETSISFCENLVNHTYGEIYHLDGGINEWEKAGYSTIK